MDDLRIKKSKGLTLMELLIAVVLLSVVMLASTSLYIAAYRFFLNLVGNVSGFTGSSKAMDTIFRTGNAAEDFRYIPLTGEIQLYHYVRFQSGKPFYAWDQFRIISGHLRWKQGTPSFMPPPPIGQVTARDPELDPTLILQPSSFIRLGNPTEAFPGNPGNPVMVKLAFITRNGSPPQDTTTYCDFAVTGAAKA